MVSSHASACVGNLAWPAGSEASSGGQAGLLDLASPFSPALHHLRRGLTGQTRRRRKSDLQLPQEVESFLDVLVASFLSSGTEALFPVLYRKANNWQSATKQLKMTVGLSAKKTRAPLVECGQQPWVQDVFLWLPAVVPENVT